MQHFKNILVVIFYVKWINSELSIKSNQIFRYIRCNTPKRVTSWRDPTPGHCARAAPLLSKKCRCGGEPLATLCPI